MRENAREWPRAFDAQRSKRQDFHHRRLQRAPPGSLEEHPVAVPRCAAADGALDSRRAHADLAAAVASRALAIPPRHAAVRRGEAGIYGLQWILQRASGRPASFLGRSMRLAVDRNHRRFAADGLVVQRTSSRCLGSFGNRMLPGLASIRSVTSRSDVARFRI